MNKRTIANLVTFFLVGGLFIVWAATSLLKLDAINNPYKVKAEFSNAVGLLPGSEVDYLGVTYGTVSQVERITGGVRITMKMDNGKKVPAQSSANIFRKSALGEQYIEFDPPPGYTGGGPYFRANDLVPMARTTVPLEFSELLRSVSRLVSAIPPQAVDTLVHEAAIGVNGRTDSLRGLADAGDRLSQMLVQRSAVLDRLATNNTRLTHVFTQHSDSLSQSVADLRQVAESLKNARGDTTLLLQRGSQLLGTAADLVAKHKGDLDCDLKTLELVTDVTTTQQNLDGLRTVLTAAPVSFDQLWDATDVDPMPGYPRDPISPVGRWVRVGFKVNPGYNPAPQFVPPHVLPAVASVPACVSPLHANAADYVPASTATGPSAILATTGGTAVAGVALALLAAALILSETMKGVRSAGE
ncbi:MAG: organic solvent transporter substrate-binding protein [Acidimicrobiales bacterium]|nr:organic solvent transporter substrate-binding protein [Acidimicrobiales bacterium]